MSVAPYKTWQDGEFLNANDLNASFLQITNAGVALVSPLTGSLDANGQEIILDADADTSVTADTDDLIDFRLQGQDLVKFDGSTASAVNGLTITASATGNPVQLTTHGSDSNIGLTINPKGTGSLLLDTPVDINGNVLTLDADADSTLRESSDDVLVFKLQNVDSIILDGDVASPVNGITLRTSATGQPVVLASHGSDTNIGITLTPKGSGAVVLGSSTVTATPGAAAVPIADGSGTLDSWISGAGSALKLLATYSPSSAASVDITSVISSTYDWYRVVFWLRPATDATSLYLRTDSSNGASFDSAANDYAFASVESLVVDGGGTALYYYDPGNSAITLNQSASGGVGVGNASTEGIGGEITFLFKGSASLYPIFTFQIASIDPSTRIRFYSGSGYRNSTSAVNALQLLFSSGNIESGTVRVYGLRNT